MHTRTQPLHHKHTCIWLGGAGRTVRWCVVRPKGPGRGAGSRLVVATSHLESPCAPECAEERERQLNQACYMLGKQVRVPGALPCPAPCIGGRSSSHLGLWCWGV